MSTFENLAAELDRNDPLSSKRALFQLPASGVYLDGNSLGLMPKAIPERMRAVTETQWAKGLIHSWNDANWFDMPMLVGDKIAPLIGAESGQVAVSDSTSVNLFKCLGAAIKLNPTRNTVLLEGDNFPTDCYIAQGLANLLPNVEIHYLEASDNLDDVLSKDIAVVCMSHVDYRTSRVRNMKSTTSKVQSAGALMLWDLSHTSGAVACDLAKCKADMAVGCTYKYLNGGPGAPAFTWVHPSHTDKFETPLTGWMGHAAPFDFSRHYSPASGIRQMVCGTPQILSLSALDAALDMWSDINLEQLWSKSAAMTDFFIDAVESLCADHGLTLITPRDKQIRGSHVSFTIDEGGFEIIQALASLGVIGDFRAPNILRFGFAPLYLKYADVLTAAMQLKEVLDTRLWDDDAFRKRGTVT